MSMNFNPSLLKIIGKIVVTDMSLILLKLRLQTFKAKNVLLPHILRVICIVNAVRLISAGVLFEKCEFCIRR